MLHLSRISRWITSHHRLSETASWAHILIEPCIIDTSVIRKKDGLLRYNAVSNCVKTLTIVFFDKLKNFATRTFSTEIKICIEEFQLKVNFYIGVVSMKDKIYRGQGGWIHPAPRIEKWNVKLEIGRNCWQRFMEICSWGLLILRHLPNFRLQLLIYWK